MTILDTTAGARPAQRPATSRFRRMVNRRTVGGFFLFTGGIHVGIVAADTELYRDFASAAPAWVQEAWQEVFMAAPVTWGLLLAAAEVTLGLLLLSHGTAVRVGWAGVIAFHVGLLSFGWGIWLWSVPALVVLVLASRADRRT